MDFKEAMDCIYVGKTVKVSPLVGHGAHPHLLKVGYCPDLDIDCLQCVCLTEDGEHIDSGESWEPVCYLLCLEDFIDGDWDVVDEDDFKEVEE